MVGGGVGEEGLGRGWWILSGRSEREMNGKAV